MSRGLLDFAQSASNAVASNVSGPVDLLALMLRKAGVPVGDAPIGGSAWMERQGLTRPVQQGAARVAGETFGLLGPVATAANADRIARGLLAVERNAAAPRTVNTGARAGQRGIFMGDLSKTWDAQAAARAEAMERAGKDARTIWQETGTFRGVDGKWRQEIDDSVSSLMENKAARDFMAGPGPAEYPLGAVSNALDHPAMGEAYPDVMKINARLKKGQGGAYIPNTGFGEGFDLPSMGTKSTTLHELQHAVQERQGFARGGNPNMTKPDSAEISAIVRRLEAEADAAREAGNKAAYMAATDARAALLRGDGFGGYRRLAGEAEARAVQSRMNLNAQQRRAMFPLDSYDVPVDQLIVR